MNFYELYNILNENASQYEVSWMLRVQLDRVSEISGWSPADISAINSNRDVVGMVAKKAHNIDYNSDEPLPPDQIDGAMIYELNKGYINVELIAAVNPAAGDALIKKLIEKLNGDRRNAFYIKFPMEQMNMFVPSIKKYGLETKASGDDIIAYKQLEYEEHPENLFNKMYRQPKPPEAPKSPGWAGQTQTDDDMGPDDPYGLFKDKPYGK